MNLRLLVTSRGDQLYKISLQWVNTNVEVFMVPGLPCALYMTPVVTT